MASSGTDAYRLGREYSVMPIPMDPAHCVDVAAGPVTFVVEARQLRPEDVIDHAASLGKLDAIDVSGVDDRGISVHVVDPATGEEPLRFDCFEHEPHYHYIHTDARSNTVVRLDDVAEGDPHAWMLRTLRRRLPEVLAHAGRGVVVNVHSVEGIRGYPNDPVYEAMKAEAAHFTASDMSSFVMGHNIPVDGGTLAGSGWFHSPEEGRFVNRPKRL